MSGRKVDLAIWVREADLPQDRSTPWTASRLAMAWDEKVYGREYDLDLFNIVAVSDFNMGAMENKSLNIFNSAYVLADQDTATDADFDNIARGRRARIFPQLVGRPGHLPRLVPAEPQGRLHRLPRPELLGADMGSPAVKRIEDVRVLRAVQFPEDRARSPIRCGPTATSRFRTSTRRPSTTRAPRSSACSTRCSAPEKFRAGTDLYFDRHDGEAATCDDFVAALEDASGVDLTPFKIWYSAGRHAEGPRAARA